MENAMLGWWIVITEQTPKERDEADQMARKAAVLAQWEASIGGIVWLSKLVEAGKAVQHSFDGYPNRYTASAGDLLPMLAAGPPSHTGPLVIGDDYVRPANWCGKVEMHSERMAGIPSDRILTIDVWDQS